MIAGMIALIIREVEERNAPFGATFSSATYPAHILDTNVEGLDVAPVFYGTDIPLLPADGTEVSVWERKHSGCVYAG